MISPTVRDRLKEKFGFSDSEIDTLYESGVITDDGGFKLIDSDQGQYNTEKEE